MMEEDLTVESVYDIAQLELDGSKQLQQGIGTLLFLFAVVGLSILLLSALATVANAQNSSNFGSDTKNDSGVKQMGICQIGAGGPCNGNNNSTK